MADAKQLVMYPPFSQATALLPRERVLGPATVRIHGQLLLPRKQQPEYLDIEMGTLKLDRMHTYLWLAGLPRPARPLHRQRVLNRTILITENPDEHLIWHESRIFIKPIPELLLSYESWKEHLCTNNKLYQAAAGLLLSYTWLISYQSDFRIAKDLNLIPSEITWPNWRAFVSDFLSHIDPYTLHQVSPRYRYGELRLSRLNLIYRFTPSMFSTKNLVRGYMPGSMWYRAFFQRNFAWLLAVFAYVTVLLSAMQVGLASERLQRVQAFQDVSYGFALAAVVTIVVMVAVIVLSWVFLLWYYVYSTRQYLKEVETMRAKRLLDKA